MDTQQLNGFKTMNLYRNPFASPTEEAIGLILLVENLY